MTSPSPMKSPDRDAADELIARLAESRTRIAHMCSHHHPPRMSIPADRERDDDLFICDTLDQAASELTTLRRRVAETDQKLVAWFEAQLQLEQGAFSGLMIHDMRDRQRATDEAKHAVFDLAREAASPLPPGRNEG